MKELIVGAICLCLPVCVSARIITVDDDIGADFSNIQAAISYCENGDVVLVHPGVYTGAGNRQIDFLGKSITVRSTDPNNSDIVNSTVIDCEEASRAFYFHTGEGPDSVVAGLKIIRGSAGGGDARGGAILCRGASPLIENCVFMDNAAVGAIDESAKGGAVYIESESYPVIVGSVFEDNSALAGDGHSSDSRVAGCGGNAFAGAIYCACESMLTLADCSFSQNTAAGGDAGHSNLWPTAGGNALGGAVYVEPDGELKISGSTFVNNKVCCGKGTGGDVGHDGEARGGAISCAGRSLSVINNCLLAGNSVLGGKRSCHFRLSKYACSGGEAYGGAIELHNTAVASIANCTITDNLVSVDGGLSYGSGISCGYSVEVSIESSILWGNRGSLQFEGLADLSYCNVQGGASGLTNIECDPCFVAAGYWEKNGTPDDSSDDFWVCGDYHLCCDSACINSGNPDVSNDPDRRDIDGEPRVAIGRVDIGADEAGTANADFDADGVINFDDFSKLLLSLSSSQGQDRWNAKCDLHKDGRIDLCDLSNLTRNWLWVAPWRK